MRTLGLKIAWTTSVCLLMCGKSEFQLYDLIADPIETRDVSGEQPDVFSRMKRDLLAWTQAIDASFAGRDYPAGKVSPPDPESIFWYDAPQYAPYLPQWKDRWEFKSYIDRQRKAGGTKKKANAKSKPSS